MSLQGELTVRLAWDGRRIVGVDVESTRPLIAGRLAVGKTADEAAAMVPRLYTSAATRRRRRRARPLDAAAGVRPPRRRCAREPAVVLETLQEYLWRLLIDWPRAMAALAGAGARSAAVRQRIAPALQAMNAATGADAIARRRRCARWRRWPPSTSSASRSTPGCARADAAAFDDWTAGGATLPASLQRELVATARTLGRSATC